MPPEILPEHLDELVTAALSAGKTAAALAAYAPSHLQGRSWETAVDAAFDRARAAHADKPKVPWQSFVTKILPARALGIDPDDKKALSRLSARDDWSAAIVARAQGLWGEGAAPRLPAVCDALVWRSLDLAGKPKKTPPEIRSHFLREILTTGSGAPERILPLLAARELGIVRADLRALREALVRRWLCGQEWRSSAPARPASIGDFASAVRESAEHATEGLFGGRKVFISSLWRGMRAHPTFGALTLDEFKSQLVAAHKAGLLALVRADMTSAMDPSAVRESETSHLEAQYHFVERGGLS
jgi:hypothetical protein